MRTFSCATLQIIPNFRLSHCGSIVVIVLQVKRTEVLDLYVSLDAGSVRHHFRLSAPASS